jgi:hypothetical protein
MSKRVVFLLATAVFPLLILWFTFAPHSRAGGSTILIDAVYYDGYAASDTDEAVRLINVSAAAVDLSSWRLNDGEDTSYATLPPGTSLAAGATLWLATDASSFTRQFGFAPDVIPNGTWPGYSNTGDEVILSDGSGTVMDSLVYESGVTTTTGWSGTAVFSLHGHLRLWCRRANFVPQAQPIHRPARARHGHSGRLGAKYGGCGKRP